MNALTIDHHQVIPKEEVKNLHFPSQEVLSSPEEIKWRKLNAQKGLVLGNSLKEKVKIVFEDSESVKQVITTIWALTDMHIILKYGIVIPLHRIYSIDACP
jgi:hypothetical protein